MMKAVWILLFALFEKVSEDIQDRGIGFAKEPSWPICKYNPAIFKLVLRRKRGCRQKDGGNCLYVRYNQASLRAFGGCLGVERR